MKLRDKNYGVSVQQKTLNRSALAGTDNAPVGESSKEAFDEFMNGAPRRPTDDGCTVQESRVHKGSYTPTTILVTCYRKAQPQEILFQLEPVLRKAGFTVNDILSLFQEELRNRGFEIYEVPDGVIGPLDGGDLRFVYITNDKGDSVDYERLPAAQIMRPSDVIQQDDGSYRQGFRLHARGWPVRGNVETLFVPEYNGIHKGELVECRWDKAEVVWRPTGKTKAVAAPWNVDSDIKEKSRIEFNKPLHNSGPKQKPIGQSSTGTPPKQEMRHLELRKTPVGTSDMIGRELEDHQLEEEAVKATERETTLWGPLHIHVCDRSRGEEIPDGSEFTIEVVHHCYWHKHCFDDLLENIPAKTFSEVEQIVTALRNRQWPGRGIDGFWLGSNHYDPRLVQLAEKLGLVKQPDKNEDEEAA